jgi:prolyl oligopeptidase PreP (S9A serine peptidase family)
MRDRNYRRKQEAAHFNKRLKFFVMYEPSTVGGTELQKRKVPINIDEFREERWVNKLKNGDAKINWMDKDSKRICNKIRRNLQKTTDYPLKNNRWYDRKDVNPQAKGYNGDSEVDIWHDLLNNGPFEVGYFE